MALLKMISDRWNKKHFETLQEGNRDVSKAKKLEEFGCLQKAVVRYESARLNFKKAKGFATLLRNEEYKAKAQMEIEQVEEVIQLFKWR